MSEAKKYDKSYKEQSVKLALEIGVKRASEELKVPYGTLYGWVQAGLNVLYDRQREAGAHLDHLDADDYPEN